MRTLISYVTIALIIASNDTFSQTIPIVDYNMDTHTPASPLSSGLYNLIFADEFNTLNTANWEVSDNYDDNGAIAGISKASNVSVNGGLLMLKIKNEVYNTKSPTWSGVKSTFKIYPNSYTEIYCRTPPNPTNAKNWPTFWFWSCDPVYSEIDVNDGIFLDGGIPCIFQTSGIHFQEGADTSLCSPVSCTDDPMKMRIYQNGSRYNLSNYQYCKYGIEWDLFNIKIYLNDYLVRIINSESYGHPMYLILGQQVRSAGSGSPDYALTYNVNYVRVYAKSGEAMKLWQIGNNISADGVTTGDICKTMGGSFRANYYPNATYSWSCPSLNFAGTTNSFVDVTVPPGTASEQTYNMTLTTTFSVSGSTFQELDIVNCYVVGNPLPMPSSILKRRIGTSCYYEAYINGIPHAVSYEWKEGNGQYVIDDIDFGEYEPNTTVSLTVKSKNLCGQYSTPKTQNVVFGGVVSGCVWKQKDSTVDSDSTNKTDTFLGPFQKVIVFNVLGKEVLSFNFINGFDYINLINNSSLNTGIYIVAAKNYDGSWIKTKILVGYD